MCHTRFTINPARDGLQLDDIMTIRHRSLNPVYCYRTDLSARMIHGQTKYTHVQWDWPGRPSIRIAVDDLKRALNLASIRITARSILFFDDPTLRLFYQIMVTLPPVPSLEVL